MKDSKQRTEQSYKQPIIGDLLQPLFLRSLSEGDSVPESRAARPDWKGTFCLVDEPLRVQGRSHKLGIRPETVGNFQTF
jgi:hypothetical protein